jgi:hypothetical protein
MLQSLDWKKKRIIRSQGWVWESYLEGKTK